MNKLHIDVETYSSIDIKSSGAYRYTQSVDFEILMVAFAFNEEPVQIIDLAQGEKLPKRFTDALLNPDIEKNAHNATFERNCFKQSGYDIPIEQWKCTAVKAAYCGLPFALSMVSKALGLGEDKAKLASGKALIRYFSIPVKPTKANGMRVRNFHYHDREKWEQYKEYCIQDVEAEREVDQILSPYILPQFEIDNYRLDQKINDLGLLTDLKFARNAYEIDTKFSIELKEEAKKLTGLENPNSPAQLKKWLSEKLKIEVTSLAKDNVDKLIKDHGPGLHSDVLNLRKKSSRTSTKKYISMLNCACEDERVHGLFQFYGANRTGRWAGRLVQLQNLPQNHLSDLDNARNLVLEGDYEVLKMIYEDIPNILSQLIRTAFIAKPGHTFAVADFSAIEARVLSWLASEKWREEVFRGHGKIYEASAAMMFNVPIESVTKGSELRQKGKTAELALGYQGSVGAMKAMDRGDKLTETECKAIVTKWRKANPKVVKLWYDMESCAKKAILRKKKIISKFKNLEFEYDGTALTIKLPSGRKLFYWDPVLKKGKWDKIMVCYKGIDGKTRQWVDVETYGGKLVENIVQAISRDLLADSMLRVDKNGYDITMHVHDELIAEVPEEDSEDDLRIIEHIMGEDIPWAKGLPLNADGYVTKYYKKD